MKILIPAVSDDRNVTVRINYLEFIEEVGGTPVIYLPGMEIAFDGILLPGGADVDTSRYATPPSFWTQSPNPLLEYFDRTVTQNFLGKVPIFGICRGLQTINVMFGGTLHQNILHQYSTHDEDLVHDIVFLNGEKEKTNSFHHQAISTLGDGLKALARTKSGIIEMISHETLPIAAVQFHPERAHSPSAIKLAKKVFS